MTCNKCFKEFKLWDNYRYHKCIKQYIPMDPDLKASIVAKYERRFRKYIIGYGVKDVVEYVGHMMDTPFYLVCLEGHLFDRDVLSEEYLKELGII